MSRSTLTALVDRTAELSEPGAVWLRGVIADVEMGVKGADVAAAFAEAGRRVGRQRLTGVLPADPEEPVAILDAWSADDAARVALLLALAAGRPDDVVRIVSELYETGDGREKAAIVRALVFLPDAHRFVPVALDCGRTHDLVLYRALACGNGFPALFYSEREFNAFAMKSVFVGVSAAEVLGLPQRLNPELSRMALDYVDERESAGRPVPPSVWDLIGPRPPVGAVGRLIGYLNHSVSEHRVGCARALARTGDARARSFLLERASVEKDAGVADVMRLSASELPPAEAGGTGA
jgi:hypothetical protein